MKTNVVMIRKMGDFDVTQRTKDGMFNATQLLKQWNQATKSNKVIAHFFENKATNEFIDSIIIENNFKHRNSVYLKTRGKYGGTWMSPLLFIDFAMWLNPSFKVKVLQFVYDELIKNRHLAGDNYVLLSSAGAKLKGYDYREVAKAIQWIVFNKTGKNLRQVATPAQLKQIADIQSKVAYAIDMGFIKNYHQLMDHLRQMYHNRHSLLKVS